MDVKMAYKRKDYCPKCRRRTEHLKVLNIKMCKVCGNQEKAFMKGGYEF